MFVPKTKPDMYQQEHPIESEDLIVMKMNELAVELEKIPASEKTNFLQAVEKCPHLVSNTEKLQFLRCEVFNADLAAKRMVAYWDKRVEIFGPVRAFLPMTLGPDGALSDGDRVALKQGFVRLLPIKADPGHRHVIFSDPSVQDFSKYSVTEMARAVWYVVHVALEDEATQCKGIVMMVYPHNAKLQQFSRELAKTIMGSVRRCLPMRLSGLHVCHPPAFFQIIFPIMKVLMGERIRKRINIHYGSQEHVLERLETKFGLHRERLPTEIGGSLILDNDKWLDERRSKEEH